MSLRPYSRTSIMEVITNPEMWGYEKVYFHDGILYKHPHGVIVFRGELIRCLRTGELWNFQYREHGRIYAKKLDIRAKIAQNSV